ncbi:MAG: DUF1802 family protein [Chloroflexi bacterium]|nr:DUF1802 family protein [Chloroflexota bacterium]
MATTALKEWAVATRALREGRQVLLVRKGGIREDTRHFKIQAREFLLFPTYEHQRTELLQPHFRADLEALLAEPRDSMRVGIDTWAQLTDLFEVSEPWQVEALAPFYCFSEQYAEERLRWKPRHPLLVMAVRAYRLGRPTEVEMRPEYGGCKSWLTLAEDVPLSGATPALDDAAYAVQIQSVRAALEQRQPTTAPA